MGNSKEHRLEHRREYYLKNKEKVNIRENARRRTEKGKKKRYIETLKYRRENPEKYAAHGFVSSRVARGKITKGPCEVCGVIKNVQAHHCDYSKPGEIMWLCPTHHTEWHKNNSSIYGEVV